MGKCEVKWANVRYNWKMLGKINLVEDLVNQLTVGIEAEELEGLASEILPYDWIIYSVNMIVGVISSSHSELKISVILSYCTF